MPILTATREVRYAGKTIPAGSPFEASDKDAKVLVAIKKAAYGGAPANKTDLPKPVKAKAVEPVVETEAPNVETRQGTYLRRDMVAENGLTGEDNPLPFLRRGRPPRVQNSTDSEDDSEQ